MKNFLKRIAALGCAGLIGLSVAGSALAEDAARPQAIAHKAETPIVLDGSLNEWNKESPLALKEESQVIRDAIFWQGPSDISAEIYVMWDEKYLYLGAAINEDTPYGALEMLPLDGEDNIELFLSVDPSDDPNRTKFSATDFLVFFVMDGQYWDTAVDRSMVTDNKRFITKGMGGGENVLDGYECAAAYSLTGIDYECKIPWACFSNQKIPLYTPATGDSISFDILITDIGYACPGTEYIPQIAWTGDLRIKRNPAMWGQLIFAD